MSTRSARSIHAATAINGASRQETSAGSSIGPYLHLRMYALALLLAIGAPIYAHAYTLAWPPVAGALGYDVEQSDNRGPWTVIGSVTTCATFCSYDAPNPLSGERRWRFVSKNSGGRTPSASFFGIEVPAPKPIPTVLPTPPLPVDDIRAIP